MGNIGPGVGAIGGYQDLPSYLHDIPEYVHQQSLGGGKVLKTLQCLHDEGFVVVKIYIKRDKELQLKKYQLKMDELREKFALHEQPGIICLQKVDETDKAAYLVRQYFAYNLYDRFHTHPFLTDIEKKWFAFQLLTAVTQMHGVGVRHGDIKTENIMVTSWNWCFLTDIAFYKPTFLPADNPADQQLYFDAGQRRRCYLAPERFYMQVQDKKAINPVQMKAAKGAGGSDGLVTEAMDIFSAGCVIAEIFLEGEAIFDLPQLLSYREGKYDPTPAINKIPDKHVRELVTHMVQRDATLRLSAKGYLQQYTEAVFPKYFGFLYKFFAKLLSPELADPDIKIQAIRHHDNVILREIVGQAAGIPPRKTKQNSISGPAGQTPASASTTAAAPATPTAASGTAAPASEVPKSPAPATATAGTAPGTPQQNRPAPDGKPATGGSSALPSIISLRSPPAATSGAAPSTPSSAAAAAAAASPAGTKPNSLAMYTASPAGNAPPNADVKTDAPAASGGSASGSSRRTTKDILDELERFTRGIQATTKVRPDGAAATANGPIASATPSAANAARPSTAVVSSFINKSMADSKSAPAAGAGAADANAALKKLDFELNSLETSMAYYEDLCKRINFVKNDGFVAPAMAAAMAADSKAGKPGAPATAAASTPAAKPATGLTVVTGSDPTTASGAAAAASAAATAASTRIEPVKGSGTGLTMILSVICSCIQNVRYPLTKLTALELLMEFGAYVEDDIALGRIVPYIVALLSDASSIVRATAVRGLTKTVARIATFSQADAHIFPEYILPSLSRFPSDYEELVRLAYAQCIAHLAETARRFLDISQYMRQTVVKSLQFAASGNAGDTTTGALMAGGTASATGGATGAGAGAGAGTNYAMPYQGSYDQELATLQDTVLKLVIDMATSGGSKVKRSLLTDITRLCVFMGRRRVNNELLPHLITVLNSSDWQLRAAFFEHIVGVSVFVGRKAFQNFLLPCMETALFDVEEFVIQRTVHALAALCQLGLFEKKSMLEMCAKLVPLTCHPSTWIRNEAISYVVSTADRLGLAKTYCLVVPMLKPFLRYELIDVTREKLIHCLKTPLTRREFQTALRPDGKDTKSTTGAAPVATPVPSAAVAAATGNTSGSTPPVLDSKQSNAGASGTSGTSGVKSLAALDTTTAANAAAVASAASDAKLDEIDRAGLRAPDNILNQAHAIAAGAGIDRSESSGYTTDPELFNHMNKYITRLSQIIQAKAAEAGKPPTGDGANGDGNNGSASGAANASAGGAAGGNSSNAGAVSASNPSGSSSNPSAGGAAAAVDDDDNLDRYTNLGEEVQIYSIEIQQTAPDNGALMTPIDRLQQDLFESLGVQVQLNEGVQNRPAPRFGAPPDTLQARVTGTPYPQIVPENKRTDKSKPSVKQPLEKVPDYIQKALNIPPAPPNLGVLRNETCSTSSFYKNHHCLDMPSVEPVEPRNWRPKGVLVATLHEHKESANCLAVSRDNLFLVSGSDDGTVRVWDCQRFKLTANARSQLTYTMRGRVTSTTVLDSSHSVACGNDLGHVHIFKVEYVSKQDENAQTRYAGMSTVKNFDDVSEGAVLGVEHFNTLTESMFVYGTMRGHLHGYDLRAKAESFNFTIEPSMGLLSAMAVGPTPFCLVAGTTRGFIVLWDLRFQVPVQIWRHNAKSRIVSITPQEYPHIVPAKRLPPMMLASNAPQPAGAAGGAAKQIVQGPLMFIAAEGTNEVVGFDVYTGECRLVFRVMSNVKAGVSATTNLLETTVTKGKKAPILPVTAAKPGTAGATGTGTAAGGTTATAAGTSGAEDGSDMKSSKVSPLSLPSLRSYLRTEDGLPTLDDQFVRELSWTSNHILGRTEREDELLGSASPASITGFLCCREAYVVTAGSDRVVRFWDLRDPASSYRISSDKLGQFNIRYNARIENNTMVYEEVLGVDGDADSKSALPPALSTSSAGGNSAAASGATGGNAAAAAVGATGEDEKSNLKHMTKRYGPVPPMTAHHEEIIDLRAIEYPVKMLATCSRDGAVKIWV